jgi:hypothetical protein
MTPSLRVVLSPRVTKKPADRTTPFIPHTDTDIRDMLAAIGGRDRWLFDEIPGCAWGCRAFRPV